VVSDNKQKNKKGKNLMLLLVVGLKDIFMGWVRREEVLECSFGCMVLAQRLDVVVAFVLLCSDNLVEPAACLGCQHLPGEKKKQSTQSKS